MRSRNRDKLKDIIVIVAPNCSFEDIVHRAINVIGSDDPTAIAHKVIHMLRHETQIEFPKRGLCSWNQWSANKKHQPAVYQDIKLKVLWELQSRFAVNHEMTRAFKEQIKQAKRLDTDAR